MPPVGEDEERPLAQVFAQAFADQPLQSIEALAQVHRLQRHEDLQSSAKAQHRRPPCATNLINSAASANCSGVSTATRQPPGSSTNRPPPRVPPGAPTLSSTTASTNCTEPLLGASTPPARRRFCTQLAKVA